VDNFLAHDKAGLLINNSHSEKGKSESGRDRERTMKQILGVSFFSLRWGLTSKNIAVLNGGESSISLFGYWEAE